jgi:hypothetical protein
MAAAGHAGVDLLERCEMLGQLVQRDPEGSGEVADRGGVDAADAPGAIGVEAHVGASVA